MTNPTIQQGGHVFADLIRVTPLDALGHPVTGTGLAYIDANITQMDYNPEIQAGPDLTQVGGKGYPCMSIRGRDTLKRQNVMVALCMANPWLEKLLVGGQFFTDGLTPGTVIGYQEPRALVAYPAVAVDLWQQLVVGDAVVGYEHHLWPKVELTPGNRSAQAQFADRQFNGFAYENPNYGDPYGDFGQDTNAIHQYVFTATEPTAAGIIDVPTGAAASTGPKTVTTAYTALPGDIIIADATTAAFTVTLPNPSARAGVTVTRKNSGANNVTISTPSGQIEGASTLVLSTQWQTVTLRSDGTNYYPV